MISSETHAAEATLSDNRAVWVFGILTALWFSTLNQLRVEWTVNAQYAYGWTVPVLAFYLFAERWKVRPATAPGRGLRALTLGVAVFALLLLPLRVVQEGAPDWRLVGWGMAGVSLALSAAFIYYAGGWPWLKHFILPVAFLLVAVPWPVPFEQSVIQRLMHAVATICVEALSWFGIPAAQHGNVIQIGNGVVGVEEACSGVRSLQTTLMAALFLGELLRFNFARRAALIGAGLLLAFGCNAGRAFLLVWITTREGPKAIERWHDSVGLAVLVVSLCGLAALTAALRTKDTGQSLDPPTPHRPRLPSRNFVIGILMWLVAVEVSTELWYRSHEARAAKVQEWSVELPTEKPGFHEINLSETTRGILRYNEARCAGWADPDGNAWALVFLRWLPGRASAQLARSHGPEICLPAAGAILLSDLGLKTLRVFKIELLTHVYIFSSDERLLYVFYCLWEEQPETGAPQSTRVVLTVADRLRAIIAGRRNLGQQVLEVAVRGPQDINAAEAETVRMLGEIIR
ncbi:MAG: hypothetical protein QOD99_405 [Chthoniobacter sp.]|jgi:exosortase|nr:hypothetical protein [Chthoniobacter sp.]